MKRRYLFMAMLVIGVGALAGALWFSVDVWPATGQGQQASDPLAEAQIAQPEDSGTANASIATRGTIVELVQASDIVIVGTVVSQADQTSSAVSESVMAIRANYTLEPERYFRGRGGTTLEFVLTVAYDLKDEQREYTMVVQSADPLTVGGRYIFFLKQFPGGVTLAAEPGRFRIEGAIARVESTLAMAGDHDPDSSDRFPARPLADLIEEVVSAAAAPAPIPPTPSEPPHEHAPHEDDF